MQHKYEVIKKLLYHPSMLLKAYWKRKKLTLPATVLGLLLVATAIPATRYVLPSLFIKKSISFIVIDEQSGTSVADVDVTINDNLYKTDSTGLVTVMDVAVGKTSVIFIKPFYSDKKEMFTVSMFKNVQKKIVLHALGRLVTANVKNRLSGRPVVGAIISAEGGGQGKTDSLGVAHFILSSSTIEATVKITGTAINDTTATVRAAQDSSTNTIVATPSGKVYFLSKQTGKIDVIKTNLDGSDRQIVLAGTGREDVNDTILLASKDWKYLVLKARRDTDTARLYSIDTKNDALSQIDQSNKLFTPIGWVGHHFVYQSDLAAANIWQPKKTALMSFNAQTSQQKVLDETRAEGISILDYASEYFGNVYITSAGITYSKYWSASYYYGTRLADKRIAVNIMQADGLSKKTIKEWQAGYNSYIRSVMSAPNKVYYFVELDGVQRSFWELSDNSIVESKELTNESFKITKYFTYLVSPSNANTFWNEPRDGKNSIFIGDQDAKNAKQIAALTVFAAYGWYTDDYLLVSKNSSELYIMGRDGIKPGDTPTKISDYHKPSYAARDYNYGYGGF